MFAVLYHHAAMSTWGKAVCWKLHTLACTGHRTTPDREQLLSCSLQLVSTYKRQLILPLILFLSKQPHLIPPFNDKRDLENRTWMQFPPCIPLCAQLQCLETDEVYTEAFYTAWKTRRHVLCRSCSPDLCVSSAKDVTELQPTRAWCGLSSSSAARGLTAATTAQAGCTRPNTDVEVLGSVQRPCQLGPCAGGCHWYYQGGDRK